MRMRPRRDLLVLLALLATCALLSQLRIHPTPPATPTATPSAPRPDAQPVLEAALHRLEEGRSRRFLIQTQTDINHLQDCPPKLDPVLWQALQQANPSPQPLPRYSTHRWITPAEVSAIFRGRDG